MTSEAGVRKVRKNCGKIQLICTDQTGITTNIAWKHEMWDVLISHVLRVCRAFRITTQTRPRKAISFHVLSAKAMTYGGPWATALFVRIYTDEKRRNIRKQNYRNIRTYGVACVYRHDTLFLFSCKYGAFAWAVAFYRTCVALEEYRTPYDHTSQHRPHEHRVKGVSWPHCLKCGQLTLFGHFFVITFDPALLFSCYKTCHTQPKLGYR